MRASTLSYSISSSPSCRLHVENSETGSVTAAPPRLPSGRGGILLELQSPNTREENYSKNNNVNVFLFEN